MKVKWLMSLDDGQAIHNHYIIKNVCTRKWFELLLVYVHEDELKLILKSNLKSNKSISSKSQYIQEGWYGRGGSSLEAPWWKCSPKGVNIWIDPKALYRFLRNFWITKFLNPMR